ncbi:RyR domain-containing protein [Pirellulales bacterium]|nr:RyR domain-containing protein [Pirellulales bacterium]
MAIDPKVLETQIAAFDESVQSDYRLIESLLRDVLAIGKELVCPAALVDARTKTCSSFAGKCVRKWGKVQDPVNEFTDLCGARIIVQLPSEVESLVRFVREHFDIDEPNSQDTRERLGAQEFGYRSVHLIVKLPPRRLPDGMNLEADLADQMAGKRAEVQLRTFAQHVWADIGHDRLYKSAFQVPATYERQSAKIAAMLEEVDASFANLVSSVERLGRNAEAYKNAEETKDEIERLKAVLKYDPKNVDLAAELSQRQISVGSHADAIGTVTEFKGTLTTDLLACRGHARCRANRAIPHSGDYAEGQSDLQNVVDQEPKHLEALTRFAESWEWRQDQNKAAEYFRLAFESDPTDPRALSGYLRHYIARERDFGIVGLLRPNLRDAVDRCQAQIDVRVNLPHSLYHIADFKLLMDPPGETETLIHTYQGLYALCRAISLTTGSELLDDAVRRLSMLESVQQQFPGIKWALRTLLVCQRSRNGSEDDKFRVELNPTKAADAVRQPVLIIAGGCDAASKKQVESYTDLLRRCLSEFTGTVISGGTQEGISGLVAGLCSQRKETAEKSVMAIGYLPATLPFDGSAIRDERYDLLVNSDGQGAFSPAEPLQSWADMLKAGVDPHTVKLIGINGGRIAAFEYHLAAALGAEVVVIRDSGRQADVLMLQEDDPGNELVRFLPHDAETFAGFMHYPPTCQFEPDEIASLSLGVDRAYNDMMHRELKQKWQGYLAANPNLKGDFDRSNRHQAMNFARLLERIGKEIVAVEGRDPVRYEFTPEEVEIMAEMEHGRWVVERTFAGWRYGKVRDDKAKRRPQLIAWDDPDLSEEEKDKDRNAVRQIPKLLAKINCEIG